MFRSRVSNSCVNVHFLSGYTPFSYWSRGIVEEFRSVYTGVGSWRGPIIRAGWPDQIRKIVIRMIYESSEGGNAQEGMKGGTPSTGVEIYGPATDASPKDDIFLSLRI